MVEIKIRRRRSDILKTDVHRRVVVRARLTGRHEGQFGDIMPSYRSIDLPFVVTYTIENRKIISHWLVADQMALMEQLGVEKAVASQH